MIRVYADRHGQKYRLLTEGHADYPDGEAPLVCAAVSALTGALVQFAKEQHACRFVRVSVSHGHIFFRCCGGLKNAFEMTVAALSALALQYPKHVMLCKEDRIVAAGREGAARK